MSASESRSGVVLELAEEFLERYRQGQRPSLKEYIDRHPELAADIKDVFPAMALMENIALADESLEGEATGPSKPTESAPPQQLGDYRILREVGRGGMGIVYEAEQVSLGRHVALKVLPRKVFVDDAQRRRFEREAKAAAKLHHTNIVPVFGVGEHDGMPYYVMQFIQGLGLDGVLDELKRMQGNGPATAMGGELRVSRKDVSAADVARSLLTGDFDLGAGGVSPLRFAQGADAPRSGDSSATSKLSDSFTLSSAVRLPGSDGAMHGKSKKTTYWQSVAQIGVQVAEALEYAHKQGIQHRDIKPSNLLLDTRGTVWVTDFGLARADNEDHLTQTGDIVGTLRYMPPEAFEGHADKRGDIYSLGLTLYEMLAMKPAYDERDRHRLIKRVTMEEPARLDKLNQQVPRDLVTIVHKAIEREPSRRYATAGELAADLQCFIADEPIKARRVSVVERIGRWYRHNPMLAALTATLVLVFLAGFAGITWKWREAEWLKGIAELTRQSEERQRAKAEAQAEVALREADRSRRLLYASDMNLVGQAWEAGEISRVRDLLERQQPQKDLHGFEWRYLWNLCRDGSRLTLRGHTSPVNCVVFSPDGQTLVTTSRDNTVRLWNLATRQHVVLATAAGSAAFSPDGKILAFASGQAVLFWDVVAKCERANFMQPGWVSALAFSPDGKLLATCCSDETIRIWNVATRQVDVLAGHSGPVLCFAFSPDGKILASGGSDTTVRLWDVASRRAITTCKGHLDLIWSLSFSPDGKTLASASIDSARLWDAVTGQPLKILRKYRTEAAKTAFSPDGKTVASGDTTGMIRIWDAQMKGGTALLRGHSSTIHNLAFAPDGRSLVSGSWDGTVKVWDVAPGPDPNILTGHKAWLSSLALSADGKTLAVGVADDQENIVQLWDLATRRPNGTLSGHKRAVWCLAFAPSGQVLATGSYDRTVRLWDVANKKQLHEFQHDNGVVSVAFSPDGKFLAACDQNAIALVYDVAAKKKVTQLNQVSRVRFSPDGKLLASASHKTIRLWDVAAWQSVAALEGEIPGGLSVRIKEGEIVALAFAPDGRTLAARDGVGILQLWDVAGKRQIASSRGHTLSRPVGSEGSVTYSPDGRRLATGGGDGLVKLWDADSLQEVAALTGHDGPVYGLAFTPDGNTLATASGDSTVRLWQAPSSAQIPNETADAPAAAPIETIRLFWLDVFGTAAATRSVEGNSQRVDVTAVDGTNWHVQLGQRFDDLEEGTAYTIRFRAKANAPRPMTVVGGIGEPDWHGIGLVQTVTLNEDWQVYHCRFQAKDLAATNNLVFQLGERKGTVWIADVTIVPADKLKASERALDLRQKAAQSDPKNRRLQADLAASQHAIALVQLDLGNGEEARKHLDRAVALRESLVKDEPKHEPYRADLAASRVYLHLVRARRFAEQKRNDEAEADLARIEVFPSNDAQAYKERGRTYFALGQTDKATADFRKAVALLEDDELEALALPSELAASETDKLFAQLADDALLTRLTAAVERSPKNMAHRWDRGTWYARHARWKEAAADFTIGLDSRIALAGDPADKAMKWLYVAPVLAMGDPEGYRRLCHEMLKRFGETQDPSTADRTAKACLLLPELPKEMQRACELADRAAALGKNDQSAPWFIFGKGLADYRRGNFRAVVEGLDSLLSKAALPTPDLTTCCHLVLSMALHQQGDDKTARDHLARAAKLLNEYLLDPVRLPIPKTSRYNHDWLIPWLLHREAKELIDGKKTELKE